MNRKICQIFTLRIRPPPQLFSRTSPCFQKKYFLPTCGRKRRKSFLKVFKKKKGCYLIKEAAINLSPSSAALLHIWPFTAATHCCSFLLRPGWDLWFLLLVSHVVWSCCSVSDLVLVPSLPHVGDLIQSPKFSLPRAPTEPELRNTLIWLSDEGVNVRCLR